MYTYPESVRELTPLFKNIPNDVISRFIHRAVSVLHPKIGVRYFIPVKKFGGLYLTGTITVNNASTSVVGVGTLFTTELYEGQMIFVEGSRQAIKVKEITDNLNIVLYDTPSRSATASTCFVLPDNIVTATEYYTAKLLINKEFSDKAYNQDSYDFAKEYNMVAKDIIDDIMCGRFHDSDLVQQIAGKNEARLIEMLNNPDELASSIAFQNEVLSNSFTIISPTPDLGDDD